MDYYGLQCYNKQGEAVGWAYIYGQKKALHFVRNDCENPYTIGTIMHWRTRKAATINLNRYSNLWEKRTKGFLSVERLPDRFYPYFS